MFEKLEEIFVNFMVLFMRKMMGDFVKKKLQIVEKLR